MGKHGRGWDHGERFQPAREVDIRYGNGIVKKESASWPDYLAITSPTAWKTALPFLSKTPVATAMVSSLDWDDLHAQSDTLPNTARLVVAVGGGKVLDAAKFFALKKDLPIILVPTAVSTGAIIHGVFARFKGRTSIPGGAAAWPYCDCEHVLVDYALNLLAPERLNTAGLGDLFCAFGGISEWRYSAKKGLAPADLEAVVAPTLNHHRRVEEEFMKSLKNGRLTDTSIHVIMEAIRDRDDLMVKSPHAPAVDHQMFNLVEPNVAQATLIHGELTALVAATVAWAAGQPDELVQRLERCKVRFRPLTVGITRAEFKKILENTPEYLKGRDVNSVLGREPVTGARFDALWSFLETKDTRRSA